MRILASLSLVLALSQFGSAGWIQAKAALAQVLIARAWSRPVPTPPWPWADTWPVARLQLPGREIDLYVLAGARGNALAFGPAHDSASAPPGEPGVSLIAGHRDTHFAFLEDVAPGETLLLTDAAGTTHAYRVTETRVADIRQGPLRVSGEGLLLVTCYPFDAIRAGGPRRYLVMAERVAAATIRPN